MRLHFTSKRLLAELERRATEFSRPLRARLVVPEEMRWWYFHEYGTATHNEKNPTAPYSITPIDKPYLKFPDPSGIYGSDPGLPYDDGYARRFMVKAHPGVRARHMITTVLDDIGEMAKSELAQSMISSMYTRDAVYSRLVEYVMQQTKNIIVQSITESLPGTRSDGKLMGNTAGQEFERTATVKPLN